jgi:protocatechuate 3,4-dioxygenase beta subunit
MKQILLILLTLISLTGCSQSTNQKNKATQKEVGGGCEGCEAIYENPVPFEKLNHVDTLPDFNEQGPKIKISGIVYQSNGKTPAKDVVLYFYHTDQTGHYPRKGNETGWGKRHGYLRGWVKTNNKGEYEFYTLKPAAYPQRGEPAHIHITVKEPDKNEYYIDDYLFDDDPLLNQFQRNRLKNGGGNGIVNLKLLNGILEAKRNITLGLNISDYPR